VEGGAAGANPQLDSQGGGRMEERKGIVTFKGDGLTLVGPELTVGQKAPDFTLRDQGLGEVGLADGAGRVRIVATVPSLDTSVCATETRTFNEKAAAIGEEVEVLVVSRDLPFAQQRFCGAEGIDRVRTLSDYVDGSFGRAWGLYIKELGLLARAVIVLDGEGTVRYIELVPEVTDEPDYASALEAARDVAG
jgi:thiol peroxidase